MHSFDPVPSKIHNNVIFFDDQLSLIKPNDSIKIFNTTTNQLELTIADLKIESFFYFTEIKKLLYTVGNST